MENEPFGPFPIIHCRCDFPLLFVISRLTENLLRGETISLQLYHGWGLCIFFFFLFCSMRNASMRMDLIGPLWNWRQWEPLCRSILSPSIMTKTAGHPFCFLFFQMDAYRGTPHHFAFSASSADSSMSICLSQMGLRVVPLCLSLSFFLLLEISSSLTLSLSLFLSFYLFGQSWL